MNKFKKYLKLTILVCIIVSNLTVISAAEEKTNLELIEQLGVIKGEGNGLTEEYLSKENKRWQVALISLRLVGKYDEAIEYKGNDNFSDADQVIWTPARTALAYLKAHPNLGWDGIGNNAFNPNENMTVKGYYKVMLEVLGYKQDADFDWDEVFEFAEKLGIKSARKSEKLTIRDIANISVEVLNAETKDGIKFMDTLTKGDVEENDEPVKTVITETIPKDDVKPTISEARAVTGTVVAVTFDTRNIDEDTLVAENFLINNNVTVTSVEIDEDAMEKEENADKTIVNLTVEGLKVGIAYTVKSTGVASCEGSVADSGDSKYIFAGKEGKVNNANVKPTIRYAEAVTGTIVAVVFDTRNIDKDTLLVENFSIDRNVTVTSVEIDEDAMEKEKYEGKTVVNLTVTGLKQGRAYTLRVTGVASCEGLVMDDSKKVFAGRG
ncbi:MAG: hypothetical protein N4A63_16450 [Vallitalea sp.]|jgi:hypothetical protein|nr:hypothetical protein [Vallitalea sp.]